jgi:hypothetical protein
MLSLAGRPPHALGAAHRAGGWWLSRCPAHDFGGPVGAAP